MHDAFISYVEAKEQKVRRIYEDLVRAGFEVWEFKTAQQYGENFIEEFKRQIENSRVFCLIDCNESRNGIYTKMEVAHARLHKKKVMILRIEELIEAAPLFEDHEFTIYIKMWAGNYEDGIKFLCQKLGREYIPLFNEAIDGDFLWEMEQMNMKQLETENWRELVKKYKEFRDKEEINFPSSVRKLEDIIELTETLHIPLVTPYLSLGNLFVNEERYSDAVRVYNQALAYFKSDPRVHAGLGAAYYYLLQFGPSAIAYSDCLDLLLASTAPNHIDKRVMIAHNLLQSLLQCSIPADFMDRVDRIAAGQGYTPELDVLRGKFLLYTGKYEAAIAPLEKAYDIFTRKPSKPGPAKPIYISALILDLATAYGYFSDMYFRREHILKEGISFIQVDWKQMADPELSQNLLEMMRLLGETYLNRSGKTASGIEWYEKTAELGQDIKFQAELASVYYRFRPSSLKGALEKCEALRQAITTETKEQKYYIGLMYYLLQKTDTAETFYKNSHMNNWPFYDELLGISIHNN
jgi:tetratricopeptide (TPR) repeat protein